MFSAKMFHGFVDIVFTRLYEWLTSTYNPIIIRGGDYSA